MVTVRFGDISHLYWQVSKAEDAGHSPSVDDVQQALQSCNVTGFLSQYHEVDLSLYKSTDGPICSTGDLDTAFEQYSVYTANDMSLSSDTNGLQYLKNVIVEILQNGDWKDGARNIQATDLEMTI